MIFVTLGTQDKSFKRLLKIIDKAIEEKIIKEKVIVQAGCTKYKSNNMEILKLISIEDMDKYIDKANLIICHGGVGTIINALKHNKKIIACPRLSKYKEHQNDHQLQIVNAFSKEGYILSLNEEDNFEDIYIKSKTFIPKKYKSNQDKFIKKIDSYLSDNHISWWNKYKYIIISLILVLIVYLIIK